MGTSNVVYFDAFDRSGGNGSRTQEEDWLDENTTAEENQWSTAQTTFYITDAPKHLRKHYENLYKTNNGYGERDRNVTILSTHIMSDVETFTSILEMPQFQRDRVAHIVSNIDLSSKNFGGKPYEKIILAVISLVSDEALSNLRDPSIDNRMVSNESFKELMRSNNMSHREHRRIRQMIREKTAYF